MENTDTKITNVMINELEKIDTFCINKHTSNYSLSLQTLIMILKRKEEFSQSNVKELK